MELLKVTKKTVKDTVQMMRRCNMDNQAIEDVFKNGLKHKAISVDVYCQAMEEIYEGNDDSGTLIIEVLKDIVVQGEQLYKVVVDGETIYSNYSYNELSAITIGELDKFQNDF